MLSKKLLLSITSHSLSMHHAVPTLLISRPFSAGDFNKKEKAEEDQYFRRKEQEEKDLYRRHQEEDNKKKKKQSPPATPTESKPTVDPLKKPNKK